MNFGSFLSVIKNLGKKINIVSQEPFKKEVAVILQELQKRSPVDSGMYKESWKTKAGPKSFGVLSSIVFYNNDSKFPLMEYGSEPDEAPWYFPGTKERKKTGKLTVAKGRVWAGGLNPGHSLTVGGAITPVLEKYRKTDLGEDISEVVLKRI